MLIFDFLKARLNKLKKWRLERNMARSFARIIENIHAETGRPYEIIAKQLCNTLNEIDDSGTWTLKIE